MSVLKQLRKCINACKRRYQIEAKVAKEFGSDSLAYGAIMLACNKSCETLRGGRRRDGSPLITHERGMFAIAFSFLGIRDSVLLTAIFLHDLYEDYPHIWPLWRIEDIFGRDVRLLVAAVSKPKRRAGMTDAQYSQAVFRRVRRGGKRAILLKCIDRLHNMLTLYGNDEKQHKKVWQTLEYVLPMAIQFDEYKKRHTVANEQTCSCPQISYLLMIATTAQMKRLHEDCCCDELVG